MVGLGVDQLLGDMFFVVVEQQVLGGNIGVVGDVQGFVQIFGVCYCCEVQLQCIG